MLSTLMFLHGAMDLRLASVIRGQSAKYTCLKSGQLRPIVLKEASVILLFAV